MGNSIVEEKEYDIRYSFQKDLESLKEWLSLKEVNRWYPVSSSQDIEVFSKNWIGFSRFQASLTAIYKEEVVGIATLFLMPYRKLIHHSMVYFIVPPLHSGKGIGTSLLRNVNHLAKTQFRFEKTHAEVYEGCPAIPLLKKGGYKEVVRQEHGVKEGEGKYLARLILEVELTSEEKSG